VEAVRYLDRRRGNGRAVGLEPPLGQAPEITRSAAGIQEASDALAAEYPPQRNPTELLGGSGFVVAVFLPAEILRAVQFD
jgi:hypothetical protein